MTEQDKKNGLGDDQDHLTNDLQYKNNEFIGITKEEILSRTNNGKDIIEYILSKYSIELKIGTALKNPFYKDTKPSFYINVINGVYLFNDFGNSDFHGDTFELAAHFYRLNSKTDFYEILKRINNDMNLRLDERIEREPDEKLIKFKAFGREDLSYWSQYGISESVLDKYKVKSVDLFKVRTNNICKDIMNQGFQIFSYQACANSYKIYQPFNSQYKFCWVGKKPENYVFGYDCLDYSKNTVIIAAGEKDALCLIALGYNAVCFNSETSVPDAGIINQLTSNFENVLVCYDNDATGHKEAKKIASKFSLSVVDISYILGNNIGNDIADYVKTCREVDKSSEHTNLRLAVSHAETVYFSMKKNLPQPFSLRLYQLLPEKINDALIPYRNPSEKDMMLVSTLVMLSGLLPNYSTFYGGKKYESNLYLFVLGKPASGKGNVNDVRLIGQPIHEMKKEQSLSGVKLSEKKMLFIPGNSSYASFLSIFVGNEGRAVLFETEADVFNDTKGQEWGDYSVALRKSFHHEMISHSRKKENEYFEIKAPKLTCIMTGTRDQFINYFVSPENGLFSRFIIFNLIGTSEWKNAFESNSSISSLDMLSKWIFDIYPYLENQNIEFSFNPEQQTKFNETLSKKSNVYSYIDESGYVDASIKRMGLILTRIGMILSIIELDEIRNVNAIICSDKVFECLILILDSLLDHSIHSMMQLPKGVAKYLKSQLKQPEMLYNSLPDSFDRKQAVEVGFKLKIKSDYLDKILRNLSLFCRTGRGRYCKVKPSADSAVL